MVRKATTSKSAAKKADARKHARPSPSPAKAVPRKEQPGHGHAKAVRPVAPKPKAAAAGKAPGKRPVVAAKPVPPKPQGKGVAASKPTAAPAMQMRPIAQAAHAGARVVGDMAPISPPRQFGQPAAALAAAK